jgi:HEAT repeat protein
MLLPSSARAKLDKDTANQVVSVLERATRSSNRAVRAESVGHLGLVKSDHVKALAVDALKDPVWEVRAAAIRTLIGWKHPAYREELYQAMLNRRRKMAPDIMPILALLKDKEAVALSHKLLDDDKAMTKNDLIKAWGEVPGKRRIAFFRALITHKDKNLAQGVQGFVLKMEGQGVLKLIEQVIRVGSTSVRLQALDRLAQMPRGTKFPWVRKLVKSGDPEVSIRAAEVLAHHGDRSVVKMLLPILSQKNNAKILRALGALNNVASKDMFPHLKRFLTTRDMHHEIVEKTLAIHFSAGDPKLLDHLRKLRNRDSIKIQAHAVYYLGLVEKGRGLPSLHEDLFHGDPNVRMAAVRAVGRIGNAESIRHLSRALDENRSGEIRKEIVIALANIHDKDIIPIVNFLITDPHPGVRKWAIIALINVKHKDAVSSLEIATHDSNIAARTEAVKAIMQLDKTKAFAVFRAALGWISPKAIKTLATLLKAEILPFLDMAATHTRPEIRATAFALLAKYPKKQNGILGTALMRTRRNHIKLEILGRLAEINGAKELTRLLTFADSREVELRAGTMNLLGEIRNKDGDDILRKSLFDSSEQVRVAGAIALLRLHGPKKRRR